MNWHIATHVPAGLVLIIEASSGKVLHELEGPTEGVEWLAWHPVGDFVVAGSEDFTAWMWNAPLGKCMTVRLSGLTMSRYLLGAIYPCGLCYQG